MNARRHPVNSGSRAAWTAILSRSAAAALLALAPAGCFFVHDHDHDDHDHHGGGEGPFEPPPGAIKVVDIETNQALDAAPGEGVGVFVEYGAGGLWRAWMTCDTKLTGLECPFELRFEVKSSLPVTNPRLDGGEGDDTLTLSGANRITFQGTVALDTDELRFDAEPGANVRLEVLLDGQPEPRFTFWIGNGAVHEGAPSNPVEFRPTLP